jgi:hypothetical protein
MDDQRSPAAFDGLLRSKNAAFAGLETDFRFQMRNKGRQDQNRPKVIKSLKSDIYTFEYRAKLAHMAR